MKRVFIFIVICLFNITTSFSAIKPAIWYTHGAGEPIKINVDLFISSTCPYCINADNFFHEAEKKLSWLVVNRYVIDKDKSALHTFYDRIQLLNIDNFSVPSIFFCGTQWSGSMEVNTSEKALLHALRFCKEQIGYQGELSSSTLAVLQQWGNASQIQLGQTITQSMPRAIIITALMEAFNPCSLFCFAAFLAFLWLYPNRKWLQLSVGAVFLLTLGIVHFVQQAHSEFYYQFIPKMRLSEVLIGLLLVLSVLNSYLKTRSGEPMKAGFFVFVPIIFTVVGIQIYQQSCKVNLSLVFDQWLTGQSLCQARHLFYQVAYQFVYLLPLSILLLSYWGYSHRPGIRSRQPSFKISPYIILVGIGVIMVAYPSLLASVLLSIVMLLGSIIIGWLVARRYR